MMMRPMKSDVDRYLLAVVSYTDAKQNESVDGLMPKDMAGMVSANPVASGHKEQSAGVRGPRFRHPWRRMISIDDKGGGGEHQDRPWVTRSLPTDPDPNEDPLIYTLSGADAGLFSVTDAVLDGR